MSSRSRRVVGKTTADTSNVDFHCRKRGYQGADIGRLTEDGWSPFQLAETCTGECAGKADEIHGFERNEQESMPTLCGAQTD